MNNTTIHLKIDISNSFRRVEVPLSFTFEQLRALLLQYTSNFQQAITVQYQDEENDWIALISEVDWAEAKTIVVESNTPILRIRIFDQQNEESDRKCCWRKWQGNQSCKPWWMQFFQPNHSAGNGCFFKRAFGCRRQCSNRPCDTNKNKEQSQQGFNSQQSSSVPTATQPSEYEQIDEENDETQPMLYPTVEVPEENAQQQFFDSALNTLQQMGFADTQRNMNLLQRFHGNINTVIQVLLSNQ